MTLQQTPETTDRLRLGDMIYISLWVHDVQRAAEFFGSVLGWSVAPDSGVVHYALLGENGRVVQADDVALTNTFSPYDWFVASNGLADVTVRKADLCDPFQLAPATWPICPP